MAINTEIAEMMNKDGQMYDWAEKVHRNVKLSKEEDEE